MKKILFTLFVAIATITPSVAKDYFGPVEAEEGRQFIYYLPKTVKSGDKLPVIIFLHGIGAYNTSFYPTQAQAWADKYHCAVLAPQALPEKDQTLLQMLDVVSPDFANELKKSAWGANVYIRISDLDVTTQSIIQALYPQYYAAGKIQINKNVIDEYFIQRCLLILKSTLYSDKNVNVDANKTFIVGLSLGGAMAYHYALSDVNSAKKLVSMSGFVSKGVTFTSPYSMPTLVFHSKTDDVVEYNGGLFNRPIEEIVNEIVELGYHPTSVHYTINEDKDYDKQINVTHWEDGPEIKFYSINKASHTLDVDLKNMGVDIFSVIGDFLFGAPSAVDETEADNAITLYPNPASDILNIKSDVEFSRAMVTNIAGQTFQLPVTENTVDVTSLANGLYIINLTTENGTVERAKFVKE